MEITQMPPAPRSWGATDRQEAGTWTLGTTASCRFQGHPVSAPQPADPSAEGVSPHPRLPRRAVVRQEGGHSRPGWEEV